MSSEDRDARLRQCFAQARAEDARRAPEFEPLAGTRKPGRVLSLRWGRLAAAAALVLLCVALAMRMPAPSASIAKQPAPLGPVVAVTQTAQPAANVQSWSALSNWRPSTDDFLPASSGAWGGMVTTSTDVWIGSGSMVSDPVSSNGKESS